MQQLSQPQIFHMMQLKAAIDMENLGMRHSSGRSAAAHAKRIYKIKGNRAKVLKFLKDMIELQKELRSYNVMYDHAFATDDKSALSKAEDAIPSLLDQIQELYNVYEA